MKSSSESIALAVVVSGVGGAAAAAAEAIRLLDLVAGLVDSSIASAAFLFLVWEEIVSFVKRCLNSSENDELPGT